MKICDPGFDINRLALISAILIWVGDLLAILAAYQAYYDSLCKGGQTGAQPENTAIRDRLL